MQISVPADHTPEIAPERAPEPIPEGKLFTVQGFRPDGTRVEGKAAAPTSHEDAVKACAKANESAGAKSGAVWFGVVNAGES